MKTELGCGDADCARSSWIDKAAPTVAGILSRFLAITVVASSDIVRMLIDVIVP